MNNKTPAAPQPEPVAMILKGSLDSLRAYQRVDTALYRPGFEPEQEWCEPLYASPPAAPSVPASQWIACSERMPDDDIQVLVWAIGQLFSDGNCWVAARAGDWFVDDDGRTVSGVTAWMDLPEAPSGEGAK